MTIIDWINQVLIYKKPWDYFSDSDKKTFDKVFFKKIFNNVFEKEDIICDLISNHLQKNWTLKI